MADRKGGRAAPKTESTIRDWDDADPSGQTYTRVLFIDSDFTEMNNQHGVFEECVFRGVRFNASVHLEAAFVNCTFVRCSFFDSTFTRCKLMGSMFDDCTQRFRPHPTAPVWQPPEGRGRRLVVRRPSPGDRHRHLAGSGGASLRQLPVDISRVMTIHPPVHPQPVENHPGLLTAPWRRAGPWPRRVPVRPGGASPRVVHA